MFRSSLKTLLVPVAAIGLLGCGMEPIPAEGVARGEVLYERCTPCHGAQGEGNPDISAPPIAGMDEEYVLRQLYNFASGVRGGHSEDAGGIRMMPMARSLLDYKDGLPDDAGTAVNMEAVAAYVAQMTPVVPEERFINVVSEEPAEGYTEEQWAQQMPLLLQGQKEGVEAGKAKFEGACAQCHGADARGALAQSIGDRLVPEGLKAPRLAGQADWYIYTQLLKFKNNIRGADQEADPAGYAMRFWVQSEDDQTLRNLASYIATLPY